MSPLMLLDLLLGRPFRPFYLRMNNGREFFVNHPEWVSVESRCVTLVNPQTNKTYYLEPGLITELEVELTERDQDEGGRTSSE